MTAKPPSDDSDTAPMMVLKNLTKKYGNFTALDNLSLSLNPGQILGMIGPNGAGKTTTIKILVGLIRPTSGEAFIDGVDCLKNSKSIKRLVGYMPDVFGSYDNMRVREYLDFFGAAFGLPYKTRSARVDEVMELSGATYMKDRYVESLSHGMKQRVGLARTMLHDPKVLILDEPVNGLDPQARIEMRDLIIHLAKMGKTILVTSHILPELARICNRVAIIAQGKLRAYGTVEEIGRQVSQQRTMEVQLVHSEKVPLAAKVLRQVIEDGAEIVESPADGSVRFRTAYSEAQLSDVLIQLLKNGVRVSQFRELQTDLEEAFMSFARQTNPTESKATTAKDVTPA